jgi:hypothetical protein
MALMLGACNDDTVPTEAQQSCIASRYSDYNPKQLDQCVSVCKACMKGITSTCTTSCKLKGAV